MTNEAVQAYVNAQVQNLADAKIKPLIQSVNSTLTEIRNLEQQKKDIDARIAKHNEFITKLQTSIGEAQQEVADLATKLTAATDVAVTTLATGSTTATI